MSNLEAGPRTEPVEGEAIFTLAPFLRRDRIVRGLYEPDAMDIDVNALLQGFLRGFRAKGGSIVTDAEVQRSEEHTSELQSLMRISYAVFCLKKKKQNILI